MQKVRRRPAPVSIFAAPEFKAQRRKLLEWLRRDSVHRRQRRPPINWEFFRDPHLLDALRIDFDGRCAFCEREVRRHYPAQHFRPTGAVEPRSESEVDHYAWLAYEWTNLFTICPKCTKAKGRQFPVEGRRAPYLANSDVVRRGEQGLLVDPTRDQPTRHFDFLIGGVCAPQTERANFTTELLRLNQADLIDDRRTAIEVLRRQLDEALTVGEPSKVDEILSWKQFPGVRAKILHRLFDAQPLASLWGRSRPSLRRGLLGLVRIDQSVDRFLTAFESLEKQDVERERRVREQDYLDTPSYTYDALVAGEAQIAKPRAADREIQRIEIKQFKAIDHLRIELPPQRSTTFGAPCLMLLGENAVGKSSTLAAMALALLGTKQAEKLKLPLADLVHSVRRDGWDQLGEDPVAVSLSFYDSREHAAFEYDPIANRVDGTPDQAAIVLGYGAHRYFSPNRRGKYPNAFSRVASLFDPLQPLRHPGDWLEETDSLNFNAAARALREVLPIGDEDDLVNHPDYGVCVSAQGQLTALDSLSEGYRSVFAVTVDIIHELLKYWTNLEDAQAVVLIDEIETHLHPRWKMRVMSSLRRAFPRVQFIATTHDPLCLRGMDDDEVIVLERDVAGKIRSVEDLPSIKGMRVDQLLTSEYFGLSSTADPETELALVQAAQASDGDGIPDRARQLIDELTIGDDATEQVIHAAIRGYLRDREKPRGSLSSDVRKEAVESVIAALRGKEEQP